MHNVKIPEGTFYIVNNKGLKKDLLFYYALKCINSFGKFYKQGFYKYVSYYTNYSISHAYKRVNKLKGLGWIVEKPNSFFLISYDKLWKDLGIDVSTHKIFKINIPSISKLETYVCAEEVKLNFQRQQYRIHKKRKSINKFDSAEKSLGADISANISTKKFIDWQRKCIVYNDMADQMGKPYHKSINPYVQISTKKVAEIMGYSSKSKGCYLEKCMQCEKLFCIRNRCVSYMPFVFDTQKYMKENEGYFDSSFIPSSTKIYKQLTNLFIYQ